jgi:FkbM family methyltransferase
MNNLIEFVDGFWWPIKGGKSCRDYTLARADVPQKVSKYCQNFNTIITAGGNVGYYVAQYAKLFQNVYTWEPESVNFCCLNLNIIEQNVYKFQGVLGNKREPVNLELSTDAGGHNLGKNIQLGNYIMTRIDDLGLKSLDLIALDVEGVEQMVLEGAVETIDKYKPIISCEVNWSNPSGFLLKLGYNKVDDVNGDWVFKHG